MKKKQFIKEAGEFLVSQGVQIDALELKRKLEKDIGQMSYQETLDFLKSCTSLPESVKKTTESAREGLLHNEHHFYQPNTPLAEGAARAHPNRRDRQSYMGGFSS